MKTIHCSPDQGSTLFQTLFVLPVNHTTLHGFERDPELHCTFYPQKPSVFGGENT